MKLLIVRPFFWGLKVFGALYLFWIYFFQFKEVKEISSRTMNAIVLRVLDERVRRDKMEDTINKKQVK